MDRWTERKDIFPFGTAAQNEIQPRFNDIDRKQNVNPSMPVYAYENFWMKLKKKNNVFQKNYVSIM